MMVTSDIFIEKFMKNINSDRAFKIKKYIADPQTDWLSKHYMIGHIVFYQIKNHGMMEFMIHKNY